MMGPIATSFRGVTGIVARYIVADATLLRTFLEPVRQVFLSGAAVTIPVVVTLLVVGVIFDFVAGLLAPFTQLVSIIGVAAAHDDIVALGIVLGILFCVVFLAGVLSQSTPAASVGRGVGRVVQSVPGVGPVYSSAARMSDVMFDGEAPSFREVKLVEFPQSGIYSLAFQTSTVRVGYDDSNDDLLVLFVPLAPNPVMGGFMVCVPTDRVYEVDLSVQEAFQAIVTSGIAMTDTIQTDNHLLPR